MSRRTKLCITALFLLLLGIPTWHLIHTWHPANPLRFRHVGDRVEKDPFGDAYYRVIEMELRNTSDATVMFLVGTFRGNPESGGGTAEARVILERQPVDKYAIPPAGTIAVDFYDHGDVSVDAVKRLQAGEWQVRKGSVHYVWTSAAKDRVRELNNWIAARIPETWLYLVPTLSTFGDATEIEPGPEHESASSAGATPP